MNFIDKLNYYHKAAYPALFVLTHEENRFVSELTNAVRKTNEETEKTESNPAASKLINAAHEASEDNKEEGADAKYLTVVVWDSQLGLVHRAGPQDRKYPSATSESADLLKYIQAYTYKNTIFVLKDFHLHFDKVKSIRILRNTWNILKSLRNMIVFVGHKFAIPGELQKEVQLMDYDLPDEAAIVERIEYIRGSINAARKAKNPTTRLMSTLSSTKTATATKSAVTWNVTWSQKWPHDASLK